jgi:hypothetical protein
MRQSPEISHFPTNRNMLFSSESIGSTHPKPTELGSYPRNKTFENKNKESSPTPGADSIVHSRRIPVDHSLPLKGPLVN